MVIKKMKSFLGMTNRVPSLSIEMPCLVSSQSMLLVWILGRTIILLVTYMAMNSKMHQRSRTVLITGKSLIIKTPNSAGYKSVSKTFTPRKVAVTVIDLHSVNRLNQATLRFRMVNSSLRIKSQVNIIKKLRINAKQSRPVTQVNKSSEPILTSMDQR